MQTKKILVPAMVCLVLLSVFASATDICIDHSAPAAPGNVRVSDSPYDADGKVIVSWNAASDQPSCSGIDHYVIYRKSASSSWNVIGQTAGLQLTDNGLVKGITYEYYVVAFDKAGHQSANSGTASTTIDSFCGDAVCSNGETCSSCQADCGRCSSGGGGGGGGSRGGASDQWACTNWSECDEFKQSRTCEFNGVKKVDTRSCGEPVQPSGSFNKAVAEKLEQAGGDGSGSEVVKDILMPELKDKETDVGMTGAAIGASGFTSIWWLFAVLMLILALLLLFFIFKRRNQDD